MRMRFAGLLVVFVAVSGCTEPGAGGSERHGASASALLTTTLSVTATGTSVRVDFTDMAAHPTNWIALARPEDPDNVVTTWAWTNGQASGAVTLHNVPPGTYEARAYEDWNGTQSLEVKQRSGSFVVGVTSAMLSTAASYAPLTAIDVSFGAMPAYPYAWIGLYAETAADNAPLGWKYTYGQVSGTMSFAGLTPGRYVARGFADGGFTKIAESSPFDVIGVVSPRVTTGPSYSVGAPIVVSYSDLPGGIYDWVGLYPVGASDKSFVAWAYTGGGSTGAVTIASGVTVPGDYVARAFGNNSFDRLAESAPFSVTGAAAPAELTVGAGIVPNTPFQVSFNGFVRGYSNWIAIAPAGASAQEVVTWTWAPDASSGSVSFGGLPAGNYEARAFYDWNGTQSYEVRASAAFTVAPVPEEPPMER